MAPVARRTTDGRWYIVAHFHRAMDAARYVSDMTGFEQQYRLVVSGEYHKLGAVIDEKYTM